MMMTIEYVMIAIADASQSVPRVNIDSEKSLTVLVIILGLILVIVLPLLALAIEQAQKREGELAEFRREAGGSIEVIFRRIMITEIDDPSVKKEKTRIQMAIRKTKFGSLFQVRPGESAKAWSDRAIAKRKEIEQRVKNDLALEAPRSIDSRKHDNAENKKPERKTETVVGSPMTPEGSCNGRNQ